MEKAAARALGSYSTWDQGRSILCFPANPNNHSGFAANQALCRAALGMHCEEIIQLIYVIHFKDGDNEIKII